jgi:hypothetical protein
MVKKMRRFLFFTLLVPFLFVMELVWIPIVALAYLADFILSRDIR